MQYCIACKTRHIAKCHILEGQAKDAEIARLQAVNNELTRRLEMTTSVNTGIVNTASVNKPVNDRKAYMREYMRRRRCSS